MNKKIITLIIVSVLLLGALSFWFLYDGSEEPEERTGGNNEIEELDNTAECEQTSTYEIVEGSFDADIPGGGVTVSGTISEREVTLFGDEFRGAYLRISQGDIADEGEEVQEFYNHYVDLTEEGNTINSVEGNILFFRLGVLDNGEITSTANISERAKQEILSSLDSGDSVDFNMQIPVHGGAGAPPGFTFACSIKSA